MDAHGNKKINARQLAMYRATLWMLLDRSGLKVGGERGIRTPETLTRLPVFKTGAFNHSATSPDAKFSRVVNYSYSANLQGG